MGASKRLAAFVAAKKDQIKTVVAGAGKRLAAFVARKKDRIKTVVAGQGLYSLLGWLYDNPLYFGVVLAYGPLVGGGIMTLGSLVICLGFLVWYNYRKVDWLGVDAVDSLRELGLHYAEKLSSWRNDSFIGRLLFVIFYIPIRVILFVARFVNHKVWGDRAAFVLLSIFEDPFVTTAYLRHGHYGPLTRRDWATFFGSVVLSNGYWILRTSIVIEIARTTLGLL